VTPPRRGSGSLALGVYPSGRIHGSAAILGERWESLVDRLVTPESVVASVLGCPVLRSSMLWTPVFWTSGGGGLVSARLNTRSVRWGWLVRCRGMGGFASMLSPTDAVD